MGVPCHTLEHVEPLIDFLEDAYQEELQSFCRAAETGSILRFVTAHVSTNAFIIFVCCVLKSSGKLLLVMKCKDPPLAGNLIHLSVDKTTIAKIPFFEKLLSTQILYFCRWKGMYVLLNTFQIAALVL
jgi:hypothetical protein